MSEKKVRRIHDFGDTDPNHPCYGETPHRHPRCGTRVPKEFVTNQREKVTCKRCIALMKQRR